MNTLQPPFSGPVSSLADRAARAARNADPRAKILLAGGLGAAVWALGLWQLTLVCLALAALRLALLRDMSGAAASPLGDNPEPLRPLLIFILFWTGLKLVLDLAFPAGESDTMTALHEAALLGLRLTALVLAGLTLARADSTRRYGLALTWALKPVAPRSAWQVGLALALMLAYIPQAQQAAAQVRSALRLRRVRRSWLERASLFAQATLASLAQSTHTRSLAIASRRLHGPEAWSVSFTPQPGVWTTVLALLALLAALTRV